GGERERAGGRQGRRGRRTRRGVLNSGFTMFSFNQASVDCLPTAPTRSESSYFTETVVARAEVGRPRTVVPVMALEGSDYVPGGCLPCACERPLSLPD